MSNENGHNGEWSPLTLPDSGAILEYRRVSHMLLADVQRSSKPPRPPLQEVDYAGNKKQEPNPAHPDYLEATQNYRRDLSENILNVAIELGVRVAVDVERVNELRETFKAANLALPVSDKVLYVTRVLCETGKDLETLRDAIIRKSQPTEEAVTESVARFQSNVSQG